MKKLRLTTLVLFFFIDIRVYASDQNCWGHHVPCVVKSHSKRKTLDEKDLQIVMAENSTIQRREVNSIHLIDGFFLLDTNSKNIFKTPYSEFSCEGKCLSVIKRNLNQVTIKALSGVWKIKRVGDLQVYKLPAGLMLNLGEVTAGGVSYMEFPQSLAWESTVKEWASLHSGNKDQFIHQVHEFRDQWQRAVESSSDLHRQIAKREIASFESQLAAQKTRKELREREDQRLKELFRKKNNFD